MGGKGTETWRGRDTWERKEWRSEKKGFLSWISRRNTESVSLRRWETVEPRTVRVREEEGFPGVSHKGVSVEEGLRPKMVDKSTFSSEVSRCNGYYNYRGC